MRWDRFFWAADFVDDSGGYELARAARKSGYSTEIGTVTVFWDGTAELTISLEKKKQEIPWLSIESLILSIIFAIFLLRAREF